MIVKCVAGCWDSKRSRQYYPGDQDEIDPLEPEAMYFDFPPGTEVYHKVRGTKTTPAFSTTRIVGGEVKPANINAEEKPILTCDICNEYTSTMAANLASHQRNCLKRAEKAAEATL